jgi:hypothetical protein
MEVNNEILIIGPPKSAKTTFLAQLYGRLKTKSGQLILSRAPTNIEGIKHAYNRLVRGLEAETTPAIENLQVEIPVKKNDSEFILNCKDYGGEQVRDITHLMEYDPSWIKRAKDNDRWVLFIRPGELSHHYDLSMKGFAEADLETTSSPVQKASDQYHFIELMQALIHARGAGMKDIINSPRLLIVMTCWDELGTQDTPPNILKVKMPLFYQFIESNWEKNMFKVLGVSAQGFPLDNDEAKNKYLEDLPESFGYLVLEDGEKDQDLTMLIVEAMNL